MFTKLILCILFITSVVGFFQCFEQKKPVDDNEIRYFLAHQVEESDNKDRWLPETDTFRLAQALLEKYKNQPSAGLAELYRKMGVAFNNLNLSKNTKELFDSTLVFFQKSKTMRLALDSTDGLLARSYEGIALMYERSEYHKDFKKQLLYLDSAIQVLQKLPATIPIDTPLVGRIKKNLSRLYFYKGDYLLAKEFIEQALPFNTSTNDSIELLTLRGRTFAEMNQLDSAIFEFSKSNDINQRINQPQGIADGYTNMAIAYRDAGNMSLLYAHSLLQKALPIYEKFKNTERIANTHVELAKSFVALGKYAEALPHARQSLSMRLQIKAAAKERAESLLTLADVYRHQNQTAQALSFYNQTIAVGDTARREKLQALVGKADILENTAPPQYKTALEASNTKKSSFIIYHSSLTTALKTYQAWDTLVEKVQRVFTTDNAKFDFAEQCLPTYEKALALAKRLNDTTAFLQFMEKSRATVLRQALQDGKAKIAAFLPIAVADSERVFRQDIAYWQKKLADGEPVAQEKLLTATQHFDAFSEKLGRDYPAYHQLKYAASQTPTVADIRSKLADSMAFVSYFWGKDSFYTLTISKNSCRIYTTRTHPMLDIHFNDLRNAVSNDSLIQNDYPEQKRRFLESSLFMYQFLLEKPLADVQNTEGGKISRLRIIPDGKLGYLNFDYLLTQKASDWEVSKTYQPPFLVFKYAISYDYAAHLMFHTEGEQKGTREATYGFGGFGLNYSGNYKNKPIGKRLTPLKYSETDVNTAKAQFGGSTWTESDGSATVDAFKRHAPNCQIVYFSGHGTFDDRNPLNSSLVFTQKDSVEFLTAADLSALNFKNNDLTITSACNTGTGQLRRGEGIISFSRILASIGARSCIMSLWSINEVSTSNINQSLLKNLTNHVPKDIALQRAKCAYLLSADNKGTKSLAYYWAGLVVVGNIEPIDLRQSASHFLDYIAVFVLLFFVGGFLFWKERKEKKSIA